MKLLQGGIVELPGLRVGNVQDLDALTGVTVIVFDGEGAPAAVDVRGSAPGTRETDLLDPINLVQHVDALVLTGGSAYGLDAASGVMRYLEGRGQGFRVAAGRVVPIVPAAVLFDLGVGSFSVRPTADWGEQAAQIASRDPIQRGNVGAGTGATTGKRPGGVRLKGGLGTAALDLGDGLLVGALVAVNAAGSVISAVTGRLYAEPILADYRLPAPYISVERLTSAESASAVSPIGNTTIGVVATTARLDKTHLTKLAQVAHDGLARAVQPAHTMSDGDTLFAVSVGGDARVAADVSMVTTAAADAITLAIVDALQQADSILSFPALSDLA